MIRQVVVVEDVGQLTWNANGNLCFTSACSAFLRGLKPW